MYFCYGPKGQLQIIQKLDTRCVLIVDSTGHRLQVARRIESAITDNGGVDRMRLLPSSPLSDGFGQECRRGLQIAI